ncbi:MAG: DUF4491 family protein [Muribaculaceae bacterium]|nr:DUF4491 family protein [Muribaculaceae bacterium]
MTELLQEWHLFGIVTGLCTFLIIGLFHPVVIKCEYHFGVKCWWWFAILGAAMCALAVIVSDLFLSTIFGVTGFCGFWTILEIFEQRERVRKGWFPANPKRKKLTK